jgi:hypothetical protein
MSDPIAMAVARVIGAGAAAPATDFVEVRPTPPPPGIQRRVLWRRGAVHGEADR